MDRSGVIVGAVVAAAVGLFALNLASDRDAGGDDAGFAAIGRPDDGGAGSPGRTAFRGGSAPGQSSRARPGEASGERGRAGAGGRFEPSGDGSAAGARGGGRAPHGPVAPGRAGSRDGSAGGPAGSRGRGSLGSSVGVASDVPGRGAPGRGASSQGRSDLVEKIAALPPEQNLESPYPPPAEGGEDVVFSLDHVAQAEQSSVTAEGVDAPTDGLGITFSDDAQLVFPDAGNARGDAGSISFEIEPDWEKGSRKNHALVAIHNLDQWANRVEVVKNERYLRYIFTDNLGKERDISMIIDEWQPGERHSITATWGDSSTTLYVDGQVVGRNTYDGALELRPGTPLYIGSQAGNYRGAGGKIENFKIFGRALDESEVQ